MDVCEQGEDFGMHAEPSLVGVLVAWGYLQLCVCNW